MGKTERSRSRPASKSRSSSRSRYDQTDHDYRKIEDNRHRHSPSRNHLSRRSYSPPPSRSRDWDSARHLPTPDTPSVIGLNRLRNVNGLPLKPSYQPRENTVNPSNFPLTTASTHAKGSELSRSHAPHNEGKDPTQLAFYPEFPVHSGRNTIHKPDRRRINTDTSTISSTSSAFQNVQRPPDPRKIIKSSIMSTLESNSKPLSTEASRNPEIDLKHSNSKKEEKSPNLPLRLSLDMPGNYKNDDITEKEEDILGKHMNTRIDDAPLVAHTEDPVNSTPVIASTPIKPTGSIVDYPSSPVTALEKTAPSFEAYQGVNDQLIVTPTSPKDSTEASTIMLPNSGTPDSVTQYSSSHLQKSATSIFSRAFLPLTIHVVGTGREKRLMEYVISSNGGIIAPSTYAILHVLPLSVDEEFHNHPEILSILQYLDRQPGRRAVSADWVEHCLDKNLLLSIHGYIISLNGSTINQSSSPPSPPLTTSESTLGLFHKRASTSPDDDEKESRKKSRSS
ncbi:uncharacterized protein L201_006949 [Kwoniella dendrophila CBS 6074]|uniref:BRCT domain-containing protein n=1 Tax=Kwoniella dendrophila CBS 6074 TaxID=1295534 RepID=A0AAX4K5B8_9TREE